MPTGCRDLVSGKGISLLLVAALLVIAPAICEPALSFLKLADVAESARADEPAAAPNPTAHIAFKNRAESRDELGEVVLASQDGGKLLLTADGQLWLLQPEDILSQTPSDEPLEPQSTEEISAELREKLAPGFLVHKTAHFVLIYNTSETYARWVGDLYERLYRAFANFWKQRGVRLDEPRFPLVALVFDSQAAYLQYAEREIGPSAKAMIGYYNMQTNRIVSFDITGVQGLAVPGQRYSSTAMLTALFSQPQAERTVATIVHEAVHQIAYNCGLQVRLADNPKWVSEGLAMFFETPDNNPRGWGTIGKVNYHQLQQFRQYLSRRPNDSLTSLISDDGRFANKDTVAGAYAESWALTYFLLKAHTDKYVAYTKDLATYPPLGECDARQRIELFKKHFGDDTAKLDAQFLAYMRRLR
ncbi:MAG: DUF1570 domain-containing protein [Aureliella sp.]|jgi:hypothetical protein